MCAAEYKNTATFARKLQELADSHNIAIDPIILSSCYSAVEYVSADKTKFFLSPARLLSLMLPECHVLGFIGNHAGAKIGNLYKTIDGAETKFLLEEGAILFKNGQAIEMGKQTAFYRFTNMHQFIIKTCAVDKKVKRYEPKKASEQINELLANYNEMPLPTCYGTMQFLSALDSSPELHSFEALPRPSPSDDDIGAAASRADDRTETSPSNTPRPGSRSPRLFTPRSSPSDDDVGTTVSDEDEDDQTETRTSTSSLRGGAGG